VSVQGPASAQPATLAPGSVVAGKLEIVRRLGAGGMGAVYEVVHQLTKHHRAMKVLHPEAGAKPEVVARFFREASAAGRIGNAHIVETFDAGTLPNGEPFLVMELLEGETLAARIARAPIDGAELADLGLQACDGVEAAHRAGIIHRDLKPENLFLTVRDQRHFLKILDFGVSKFQRAESARALTGHGHLVGTPFYMPPEQLEGGSVLDARADVYALGVILYECAARKRPFDAETLPMLAVLIHEAKPEPLGKLRPDLPAELVAAISRAMHRDVDARYASAQDFAAAITAASAASSVPPRSATPADGSTLLSEAPPPRAPTAQTPASDAALSRSRLERNKTSAWRFIAPLAALALAFGVWLSLSKTAGERAAAAEASANLRASSPAAPPSGRAGNPALVSSVTPISSAAMADAPLSGAGGSAPLVKSARDPARPPEPPASREALHRPPPAPIDSAPPTAASAASPRAAKRGLETGNPFR
jgi:eukaryotic-like serine/threonine-protein kinase